MAFTKVVGAGIHTLSNITSHNINSSGIITATKFVGPFDGTNGDFSGDVTIDGNLTVNGTTTTLDTNLTEVDKVEVAANNSTVGVAITQSGSGDILNLFDGTTEVLTVKDGGNVGINESANINGRLHIQHDALNENILYASRYNQQSDDKPVFAVTQAHMNNMSSAGLVIGNHNMDIHLGPVFGANAGVVTHLTKGIRIGTGYGQVGINTNVFSNSFTALTVKNAVAADFDTVLDIVSDDDKVSRLEFSETSNSGKGSIRYSYTSDANFMSFYTNGTASSNERLRIGSDGKVGIGTDAAGSQLSVGRASGNTGLTLDCYGVNRSRLIFRNSVVRGTQTNIDANNGDLRFVVNSGNRLNITSSGNIGVGITNPDEFFHVKSSSNTVKAKIESSATDSYPTLMLKNDARTYNLQIDGATDSLRVYDVTATKERLRITSDGVIETGTAVGASGADGDQRLRVGRDGNCNIAVRATASTTAATGLDFGDSGDDKAGRIQYMHNGDYMSFHTNGAGSGADNERLRIDSTGALGLGVGGITSYFKNNSGNYRQLQIGLGAHFYGRTDDTPIYLVSNGYRDGSNWKYTANTTASQIAMGTHIVFETAGSGTAGNNISFDERLRITSGGHMGLGDNAPAAFTNYTNFSIHGASGGAITFGDDGTDEWEIYGGDGSLRVYDRTNSTERLRITDGGRVGINQSTPTAELEVCPITDTADTATIFINAKTHDTNVASEAILKFGYGHSGSPDAVGYIKLNENGGNNFDGDLIFGLPTNNSAGGSVTNERFRIRYNGQVSISDAGNTFGNARLSIRPTNRTTAFSASDGDTWHDLVLMNGGGAQTNAVGIAFEIEDGASYHKNAGTGICAVKNGTNSDYGSDLVFITRPQSAVAQERARITSAGDFSIGGRDTALANYSDGSTTPTQLAVVKDGGSAGSGYHEVAHFTAGTDTNDTGAIVRITQFNNDRGMFIKAGRGTNDQAKAIIGLRNSSGNDDNWLTLIQNTDQINIHKNVDFDNSINLSLGGITGHAPLHVRSENTSYGKNAVFGASGWVNHANYHQSDANVTLLGRDLDGNDKGCGIEFTVRNTGDTNWNHGAITFGQDGFLRMFTGGAGTYVSTEKFTIDNQGNSKLGTSTPSAFTGGAPNHTQRFLGKKCMQGSVTSVVTLDSSGNGTFDLGRLWLTDDSSTELFIQVMRNDSTTYQTHYCKAFIQKVRGTGMSQAHIMYQNGAAYSSGSGFRVTDIHSGGYSGTPSHGTVLDVAGGAGGVIYRMVCFYTTLSKNDMY